MDKSLSIWSIHGQDVVNTGWICGWMCGWYMVNIWIHVYIRLTCDKYTANMWVAHGEYMLNIWLRSGWDSVDKHPNPQLMAKHPRIIQFLPVLHRNLIFSAGGFLFIHSMVRYMVQWQVLWWSWWRHNHYMVHMCGQSIW